ncbi:MAG: hypothetical protein JST76_03830 [Bacteroidetes bacterium]|nr:hypothetical protein [Bacteroidota bacterium]
MTTITVSVHNPQDAELLKAVIQQTDFKDEVEILEDTDEYSAEDIAEWDKRMEAFEKDPSRGKSGEDFMKELRQKYGL